MKKCIITIMVALSILAWAQVPIGVHVSGSGRSFHCYSDCCSDMQCTSASLPISPNNCSPLPVCCIKDHSTSITQVNRIQSFKSCKTISKYKIFEYKSFNSSNGKCIVSDQDDTRSFLIASSSIPLRI